MYVIVLPDLNGNTVMTAAGDNQLANKLGISLG